MASDSDQLLKTRDRMVDSYLKMATVEESQILQTYLLDGENSLAALNVPQRIRQAQVAVLNALEEMRDGAHG